MQVAEKDPDKLFYGPKMLANIRELVERYDMLYEVCEEELKPSYEPLLLQKLQQQEIAKSRAVEEVEKEREQRVLEGRAETAREVAERDLNVREQKAEELEAKQKASEVAQVERQRQVDLNERLRHLEAELAEVDRRMCELKELDRLFFALSHLLHHPANSPLAAVASFRDALDTIHDCVAAIASHPDNIASRVYRFWNELFQANIASKPGALTVLRVIGFKIVAAKDIEPVLRKLGRSVDVPEEVYLYMKEPDISEQYEEWVEWMDQMEQTKNILGALSSRVHSRVLAASAATVSVEELAEMLADFKMSLTT
eukprot:GHVS01027332.1.p1 GENE.GHVS01027332.1~~GHVS01027332.1.p1  ORF type:complete len:313 (+),score=69.98 GHVS01027332.1:75-1013(+)